MAGGAEDRFDVTVDVEWRDGSRAQSIPVTRGSFTSLAYGRWSTLEIDMASLLWMLPGSRIVDRDLAVDASVADWHLRILESGVTLSYLRVEHSGVLPVDSPWRLADVDAACLATWKAEVATAVDIVLRALCEVGAVSVGVGSEELALPQSDAPLRYNCHFFAEQAIELTDRGMALPGGGVILPYTYWWSQEPDQSLEQLMGVAEPADVAVAQRAVMGDGMATGLSILDALATQRTRPTEGVAYRRFVDEIRVAYHWLDGYRYNSKQSCRSVYLGARETMGLDGIQSRGDSMLDHVGTSLLAAATQETQAIDARLNRAAGVFTLITAAALLLDVVGFLAGGSVVPVEARVAVVIATVVLLGTMIHVVVFRARKD